MRNYNKLITIDMPKSVISEIYRQIRTNIDFIDIKSINITSTLPNEAKTITICNLANVFAASKKKVLLIDADIRKPKIHHIFKVTKEQGLTDLILLQQQTQFNKEIMNKEYKYFMKATEVEDLKVITAGSKVSNPSELLNSKEFNNFIKSTRDVFDVVLIDCPPVGVVTDASIVSQVCDGTLFVIQSNRNSYEAIKGALNRLKGVGTNILGVILTRVDVSNTKEYQEYGFYGYNYEYYRDDEYVKKQRLFSKLLNKIIKTK